ncbi:hypothetical protein K0M31_000618 [Melipona bicolor]|uniref:Uncharacterized protein n=1 Tax=Melipona bicolor TaxID=60889 RepID=A0AA40GE27_9HYME|nr:hypothetical protein K0M31_000618 [Melipona bicolor]
MKTEEKGERNEARCFDVLLKIAIPDLNSIRIPSGVLEADLLHKPRTMDAHVHRCTESKKSRGTNPTSCKIKSQFVLPKVGCDLRVGSNKNTDPCGVCGGNGSSCQSRYSWSLESISACSKSCGGGFKIAMAVCKAVGSDENVVDDSYCDPDNKPEKTLIPCNTHPCSANCDPEEVECPDCRTNNSSDEYGCFSCEPTTRVDVKPVHSCGGSRSEPSWREWNFAKRCDASRKVPGWSGTIVESGRFRASEKVI